MSELSGPLSVAWREVADSPLFGLMITLLAYSFAFRLFEMAKRHPAVNPVLVSMLIVIPILLITGVSYEQYFEGGQIIHFLLGPATVALAIPLYRQLPKLKQVWLPVVVTTVTSVTVVAVFTILICDILGVSDVAMLSMSAKHVTTPVAMAISEEIGGIPSLTVILVFCTGIGGAIVGPYVLKLVGFRDAAVKGMAMGLTCHGIGTARALQINEEMGSFSGLGMALATIATALILPWLILLLV